MEAPDISLQWLRPLVEAKTWDFCVLWKLANGPSRSIAWAGCCCSGAYGALAKLSKGKRGGQDLTGLCRDVHIQHNVGSMACEALACFPYSIPLCSGSRGGVVMMNEAKWLIYGEASASSKALDGFDSGTQVLIPVFGGLVELYNSKMIQKDQKTINFVQNRFKQPKDLNATPKVCQSSCLAPIHFYGSQYLSQTSEPYSNPSIHGSSTASTPASTEHMQCDSPLDQSADLFVKKLKLHCNQFTTSMKSNDSSLTCINNDISINEITAGQKRQRGQCGAKHLATERKRRNRIKDGLYALRAIVPKITKMDMTSILGDAINYIEELQQSWKKLENELNEIEAEDDISQGRAKTVTPDLNGGQSASERTSEKRWSSCSISYKAHMKVHVEVNQIGASVFLLRFIGTHCRGEFSRMVETMDSLGLQVLEANVTTLKGVVLSVFRVKARTDVAYDSPKLKDVLVLQLKPNC